MHRNFNVRFEEGCFNSPSWMVKVDDTKKGKTRFVTTSVTTPERQLKQVVRYEDLSVNHTVCATIEWMIKEEEDFLQFIKYRPKLPMVKYAELIRAKELIGDDGILAPWFWGGVFNFVTEFRKVDDILMDAAVEPDFYNRMMDYFTGVLIDNAKQLLDIGVDVLSCSGNIASGTMVGPKFFRENIFKYEKRLIDFIQDGGTHVLYHNCGDARNMIDVYNELGIHGFESVTEPPYADNDLMDAVTRFSKDITLIGNLDQISLLRTATPKNIEKKVIEKMNIIGERLGFIFGTSDFLEEDTPHENLYALSQAVKNYKR